MHINLATNFYQMRGCNACLHVHVVVIDKSGPD